MAGAIATPAGDTVVWPNLTPAGRARRAALDDSRLSAKTPTSLVAYRSAGTVLIVGPETAALDAGSRISQTLRATVLATDGASPVSKLSPGPDAGALSVVRAPLASFTGHLGAFTATVSTEGGDVNLANALDASREHFDLVLDLSEPPLLDYEVPPPGYYPTGTQSAAVERAIAELTGMVGDFEKPKYFNYNPDICAHGASGLTGCTGCLDACPTGAIASLGDKISVDSYLCQGGGSCATACPTGAITYVYPRIDELLADVRGVLKNFSGASGDVPIAFFYDSEAGAGWVAENAARLPERLIPFQVEEVGSLGLDAWLTTLCYGASQVVLLTTGATPARVRETLERQVAVGSAILAGLGFPQTSILVLTAGETASVALDDLPTDATVGVGGFAAIGEKRTTLRLALDHLYANAPKPVSSAVLPAGAPFGEIQVNRDACTLCMACVSVCPAVALQAGGESPALRFIEWNCVQCGLCETACPEDAITRQTRILYDPESRRETRTLNEEAPFCCVSCGKPFATQSVMAAMRDKLKDHWMFQKPDNMRRLEMCDDCRVKDMFAQEAGLTETAKKPQ